jgi:membrane protease YdiL (CAAX protease family)
VGVAVGTGGVHATGGAALLPALGGPVFGELRGRSGRVVAGAAAHWAFNALGVLFGLLAWRIDPQP